MSEPLGAEPIKLLSRLIKAARTVPRPRQKFAVHGHEREPAVIFGAGLPEDGEEVLVDDVLALHNAELINGSWNYAFDPQVTFTITPRGERLYDEALRRHQTNATPAARLQPTPPTPSLPMSTPPSFFISYSHADKPLAIALKAALVARGAAAWRDEDELRAGDSLVARVADAVHEFEYMAVLVSDDSRNSEWCRKELSLAVTGGLKQGRVKVMPLRVGDTEMPDVIADLVYVPIDAETVEAAADRLIKDAASYASEAAGAASPEPRTPQAAADSSSPVSADDFSFTPLKITGVVAEGMGTPRNDGSRGSALYAVPLQLSRTPSQAERQLLVGVWNRPPRFTTMHRPGIASVQGDRFVLDGTTIDEIESHHADTLRGVIEEVNRRSEELARREHDAAAARDRERAERIERARRLSFE